MRANIIGGATRINHTVRHLSLESTVSGERNDSNEIRLVYSEIVRECADVPVILPYRILKTALLTVDGLRPFLTLLGSEYPAGISLCLDDENAIL